MKKPSMTFLSLVVLCLVVIGLVGLSLQVSRLDARVQALTGESRALSRTLTKDVATSIGGERFTFRDTLFSTAVWIVSQEVPTSYAVIDRIAFQDGDVVMDVGAHVGMVTSYIGRKHPNVKIYALEPSLPTFRNLLHNLQVNRIENVVPLVIGIGDREEVLTICMQEDNTGGSRVGAANCVWAEPILVVDVNRVFSEFNIEKVRLLKIDCEGCEKAFFRNITPENLRRIEYITGEVHCEDLRQEPEYLQLLDKILGVVPKEKLSLEPNLEVCPQVLARLRPSP